MKTGVPFHGGDEMSVFSLKKKKKRKQIEEQSRSLTKIFMESTVNSTQSDIVNKKHFVSLIKWNYVCVHIWLRECIVYVHWRKKMEKRND